MKRRIHDIMKARFHDIMISGFLIDGHELMFLEEFREGKFDNLIIL